MAFKCVFLINQFSVLFQTIPWSIQVVFSLQLTGTMPVKETVLHIPEIPLRACLNWGVLQWCSYTDLAAVLHWFKYLQHKDLFLEGESNDLLKWIAFSFTRGTNLPCPVWLQTHPFVAGLLTYLLSFRQDPKHQPAELALEIDVSEYCTKSYS